MKIIANRENMRETIQRVWDEMDAFLAKCGQVVVIIEKVSE